MTEQKRAEQTVRTLRVEYERRTSEYWEVVEERMSAPMDIEAVQEIEIADSKLQAAHDEFRRALHHWQETLSR